MVAGAFKPTSRAMFADSLRPTQRFFPVEEIEQRHRQEVQAGTFKLNSGGADQLALQRALEQSRREQQPKQGAREQEAGKGASAEPRFFQGKGVSLAQPGGTSKFVQAFDATELKVLKLSLKEVG